LKSHSVKKKSRKTAHPKDFSPEELENLQHLKIKIEVICEPGDLKRITGLLKELARPLA
jgi:hypothetical protein